MPKFKAVKVSTPGSQPVGKLSPGRGRGRPKKAKERRGTARKNNYRSRYLLESLQQAVEAVKQKKMSVREAAHEFKVPKSTISDRIQGKHESLGRPTELSAEEEEILVERLTLMADWGFPLTSTDLCILIQAKFQNQILFTFNHNL